MSLLKKESKHILNEDMKENYHSQYAVTKKGVSNKSLLLLSLMTACALIMAFLYTKLSLDKIKAILIVGLVVNIIIFITVLIKYFTKGYIGKIGAILFALSEGLIIGYFSMLATKLAHGDIIPVAILGTLVVCLITNVLYRKNIVKVNRGFISFVFIATLSLAVFYLVMFIGSFFGLNHSFLLNGSVLGILIASIGILLGAMNLIIDYAAVDEAINEGLDNQYEWTLAFNILNSVEMIYVDTVRLLINLSERFG